MLLMVAQRRPKWAVETRTGQQSNLYLVKLPYMSLCVLMNYLDKPKNLLPPPIHRYNKAPALIPSLHRSSRLYRSPPAKATFISQAHQSHLEPNYRSTDGNYDQCQKCKHIQRMTSLEKACLKFDSNYLRLSGNLNLIGGTHKQLDLALAPREAFQNYSSSTYAARSHFQGQPTRRYFNLETLGTLGQSNYQHTRSQSPYQLAGRMKERFQAQTARTESAQALYQDLAEKIAFVKSSNEDGIGETIRTILRQQGTYRTGGSQIQQLRKSIEDLMGQQSRNQAKTQALIRGVLEDKRQYLSSRNTDYSKQPVVTSRQMQDEGRKQSIKQQGQLRETQQHGRRHVQNQYQIGGSVLELQNLQRQGITSNFQKTQQNRWSQRKRPSTLDKDDQGSLLELSSQYEYPKQPHRTNFEVGLDTLPKMAVGPKSTSDQSIDVNVVLPKPTTASEYTQSNKPTLRTQEQVQQWGIIHFEEGNSQQFRRKIRKLLGQASEYQQHFQQLNSEGEKRITVDSLIRIRNEVGLSGKVSINYLERLIHQMQASRESEECEYSDSLS